MRTLLFIAAFLVLPLLAVAVDPPQQSDEEIRQKIIGIWIHEGETTNKTFRFQGTVAYSTNGCYVAQYTVTEDGKSSVQRYEGFWLVQDGILTDTVTNTVGRYSPPVGGSYEHARVIKVDENELILESGKKIKIRSVERRSK